MKTEALFYDVRNLLNSHDVILNNKYIYGIYKYIETYKVIIIGWRPIEPRKIQVCKKNE